MDRPDLSYLTRGETAPQRLAVGGLLAVLGVTWPLLLGYAVGVARATFRGETAPPAIEEWEPIVRDGAIATVIVVVIALPPATVAVLTGWPGDPLSTGAGLTLAALALASAYAIPGALARFAHRDSLVAGLDAWTLLDVLLLPAYARIWFGLAVAVGVLVGGARAVSTVVEGTGASVTLWILATLLGYVLVVYSARAIGRTYARIMRLEADVDGVARRSSVDAET